MLPAAFLIGQEDFKKGVAAVDCPYDFGTKEAESWLQGWNEAMEDHYGIWSYDSGDEALSHR